MGGGKRSTRTHNLLPRQSFFFLNQKSAVVYFKNRTSASCPFHKRRKLCSVLKVVFELCFLLKSSVRLWYSTQLEIGWELSRYNSMGT